MIPIEKISYAAAALYARRKRVKGKSFRELSPQARRRYELDALAVITAASEHDRDPTKEPDQWTTTNTISDPGPLFDR